MQMWARWEAQGPVLGAARPFPAPKQVRIGGGEKSRRGRPKIPRGGAVTRVREGELEWAAGMRAEAERLELRAKKLRQALALLVETD